MKTSILLMSYDIDIIEKWEQELKDIENIFIYKHTSETDIINFLEDWEVDLIISDKDMVKYSLEDYIELFDDMTYILQDATLPLNIDKIKNLLKERLNFLDKLYKYLYN